MSPLRPALLLALGFALVMSTEAKRASRHDISSNDDFKIKVEHMLTKDIKKGEIVLFSITVLLDFRIPSLQPTSSEKSFMKISKEVANIILQPTISSWGNMRTTQRSTTT